MDEGNYRRERRENLWERDESKKGADEVKKEAARASS